MKVLAPPRSKPPNDRAIFVRVHSFGIMNTIRLLVILALLFPILVPVAKAAELPASQDEEVERAIRQLSEGQIRVFEKAVRFCASREIVGSNSIADAFQQYLANFALGTRAGFAAVKATEWIAGNQVVESTETIAMQARQGDMLAQSVQAAPAENCIRLSRNFGSSTEAFFRDFTIQSYREYQEKRHTFCLKDPRPANCMPGE